MMNTRDTLDTVFDLAISKEAAAHLFYSELATKVKHPAVRETLERLAKEEVKHQDLLTVLKAEPLIQTKFDPVADYHIAETEPEPEVRPGMPLRDVVSLAMKNEQQAATLYRRLSALTSAPEVRDLFVNLMNMELGHKRTLEDLFVDIGYPEVF